MGLTAEMATAGEDERNNQPLFSSSAYPVRRPHAYPDSNHVLPNRGRYGPTAPQDENRARSPALIELPRHDSLYDGLLLQPDSRPISQEQLQAEVKSIYAGLTMVETKCKNIDHALAVHDLSTQGDTALTNDQLHALIAIHRTLSQERKVTSKPELYKKKTHSDTAEREFRIAGFIDSATPVDALGDAGSNRNAMDEAYVRRRGYNIDDKAASIVRVGQKTVKTIGVVNVSFRFRDETTSYSLRFHVISNCPQDVILSYPFLKATKTLSNAMNFARRVFDQVVTHMTRYYDMLYIGDTGPTFTGTIGGRPYEALADTGSKVLIMDEGFARSRGLPIINAKEYCIKLRFADGSIARTSGMTQGVIWQFGLANEGKSFPLDFYILKDAPSDVILSENFLLRESRAFTEYSNYLLDDYEEEEDEEDGYIFVIRKETNLQYKGQYNGADQLCNDIAWGQEKDLRRNEDYRISVIQDATTRRAAEAVERLRRQEWDNAHIVTQTVQAVHAVTTNQIPPDAPGVQPSCGGTGQSQSTAQQSSSGTNQPLLQPAAVPGNSNMVPPSSRRHRFKKYLNHKRKRSL